MTIRKAVIPAAGLGTRFLPATKVQPKEMIPVVDRPGIQYVVEEAVRSGIDDIIIVTGRGKSTIEDHFDAAPELERNLEAAGKTVQLQEVRAISQLADIHFIRQKEPLGFGHAVAMARRHVGDQPFVVLVGDEIVPEPAFGEEPLVRRMIEAYDTHGGSVVAVQEVPKEDVSSYGVIACEDVQAAVVRVTEFVEKPSVEEAPSNLASRGRYVLSPAIFEALDATTPGVGGEIQLTDAINLLARQGSVFAYVHDGPIFDVGKKLDFLKATIRLAMRRDDLAQPLGTWLRTFVADLD